MLETGRRRHSRFEVQIAKVYADGPLAGIVNVGDTLVAVDDVPCLLDHELALESLVESLEEKVGDIKLTIKPLHLPCRRLGSIPMDTPKSLDSGAPLSMDKSTSVGSSPLKFFPRPISSLLSSLPQAAAGTMFKGVYTETLVVSAPLPDASAPLALGRGLG